LKSLEIEVKVLGVDRASVVAAIERAGGRKEFAAFYRTFLYDFPDRRMLAQGGYVRIRNEGAKWVAVCKKRAREGGGAGAMEEVEVGLSDSESGAQFLEALGLRRFFCFEKKRTRYSCGCAVFDMDELPGLPSYLEIEAPSWEEVDAALGLLGIAGERALRIGLGEFLALCGVDPAETPELRFPEGERL
jgi:adenylate cyclase class 2